MSDAEWIEAEVALRAFACRSGTLVRDEVDLRNFGNRLIEAAIGDVSLRLVLDRGTPIITVGGSGRWHSPRKLFGYAEGLSPEAALDRNDSTMTEVIEHWPQIAAIVDDPDAAVFEESVSYAYMARVNSSSRFGRVAAE